MNQHRELPVWRSMMYVPVNVEKYVQKAHTRGADAIILDLEDSIAPADKAHARTLVQAAAQEVSRGGADVIVRINRPLRLAIPDMEACISPRIHALALPKTESAGHVRLLSEVAAELEAEQGMEVGSTRFITMVETPSAFFRMEEIAKADPRVVSVTVGGEDFALSNGMQPEPDGLYVAKITSVIANRAAGIVPLGFIGSVADFSDLEAFRRIIERSKRLGFEGAGAIHPAQVKVINEVHGVSEEEVAQARRIVAANAEAIAAGRASFELDGKMIDVPVALRAERLLQRHEAIAARERRMAQAAS